MNFTLSRPIPALAATLLLLVSPILVFTLDVSAKDASSPARVSEAPQDALESVAPVVQQTAPNPTLRELQSSAIKEQHAAWGHWGNQPNQYSTWTNHSNRLVPLYTFGMTLDHLRERGSFYADAERLKEHFGSVPKGTLNPTATYHDQVDVFELQRLAAEQGKRHIILMVFDGADWQTTRNAAIYHQGANLYDSGRGRGLAIQDYRGVATDFALIGTTPRLGSVKTDVNSQIVQGSDKGTTGGFDPNRAGPMPWQEQARSPYLMGRDRSQPHEVTDSASSATSLMSGVKTFNAAIGVAFDGSHAPSIGRELQSQGFRVGVVTNVPVSHATPAAAYANNVHRNDYQDIARDLIGLPSISNRRQPLLGVDVLIGGGWGEVADTDRGQGDNFMPGNRFLHESDVDAVRLAPGETDPAHRKYVVAERTAGQSGAEVLAAGAARAAASGDRFLGFFGTKGGHLPYRTASGDYNPTVDIRGAESYTEADVHENPTLAQFTEAALQVLSAPAVSKAGSPGEDAEHSIPAFWMLVEAGDVDWANHANNIDNSIGAMLSGDEAFQAVTKWVESNDAWDDTVVLVTSDHGHYFVLQDPQAIADAKLAEQAP